MRQVKVEETPYRHHEETLAKNGPLTLLAYNGLMSSEHTITVRYFAAAESASGKEQETLALAPGATLGWLRSHLINTYGDKMAQVLKGGSFLIDGIVHRDDALIQGDQVDVLPPFAGG